MKRGHEPIRECVCCGQKFPKTSLVRIVKNEEGICFDQNGKSAGRGAYLCKSPECLEKLVRQKRLNRAFKQAVDDSVYRAIAQTLQLTETNSKSTKPVKS